MSKIRMCRKKTCLRTIENTRQALSQTQSRIVLLNEELARVKKSKINDEQKDYTRTELMKAIAQMVDAASHALLNDRRY